MDLKNLTKMLPTIGVTTLKDLIKQIRQCKTLQEERTVIQKESALIRTAFKEENQLTRYINIEKLLYIHMLGYPAHFGQIECLKLAASPRFSDKKLAYLGTTLLLDENQATLTLVTNCLKNDMNNSNVYIVGLALCTLGNIASQEMARDLSGEVERLLGSPNSYVRKKACLTALRIVKKVPDLADHFVNSAQKLLTEKNHGVLLSAVTLMEQMCFENVEITDQLRQHVPALCKSLRSLIQGGSSPEHDVNGITDPFLQVKLLRLLRVLGKGNQEASEKMNDVLAQVATATEASKNVGNAILYEAVLTIMYIESDTSLRVLAINILGRFLQNKDNNIKYVALTTLTKTSQQATQADATALQRHRSTVLDCLKDADISIRKRALDLSFYLINQQNIRILARELLSYLEIAENESKGSIASRICEHAGRYRPNKRWEIDTIIRVLRVAGQFVDQSVINYFVKLVTTGDQVVYQYCVGKLYHLIKDKKETMMIQEGLLQAAFWCIGEYGDILVSGAGNTAGFSTEEDGENDGTQSAPTEQEVVDLVVSILKGPYATSFVQECGVTCLVKLSARFKQDHVINTVKLAVSNYRTNLDVEIQQRAVEYTQIFGLDRDTRFALLEHMPVLQSAVQEEGLKGTGQPSPESKKNQKPSSASLLGTETLLSTGKDNIMDLLGGLNLGTQPTVATSPSTKQATAVDLLGDLFGSTSTPTPAPVSSATTAQPRLDPLADLLGGSLTQPAAPAGPTTFALVPCYEKNGLTVTLQPLKESPIVTQFKATFTSQAEITNLLFQVAVPKTFKLAMQPASGNTVVPSAPVTQLLKIENASRSNIRLRIKLSYTFAGGAVDEIVDCSSFDPQLWA